jgi:hypothetical protein
MQKIIFLDIDGVLAIPITTTDSGFWGLSDEKQLLLKKILEQTDAKIVLSSSWRYESVDRTKEHLKNEGFWFNDYLIGVTIRAYHYITREPKIHLSIPRGVEIKQWIDTNIHSKNGLDWNRKRLGHDFVYIILDDDSDMLLEQKDFFIRTHPTDGLSESDAELAIKILNGN